MSARPDPVGMGLLGAVVLAGWILAGAAAVFLGFCFAAFFRLLLTSLAS